jgi:3-oxoacyl-[acyl-carrier-protein] synthase III
LLIASGACLCPQPTEWQQIGNQIDPRTIWIVDAHGYEKRFIVRADEKLSAFLELEGAIHEFAVSLIS